jgi:hypothetical protein
MASMGVIDLNLTPQINVGGTTSGWNIFHRGPRVYSESVESEGALTRTVCRSKELHDLCCSVGTADFVVPWLQRLYRNAESNHKPAPKIQRVLIRHLPYALIEELSRCGVLDSEFGTRLRGNVSNLINDSVISSHGARVEVRPWSQLPPFHGHLYSQDLIVGVWSIDSAGRLHVQTPMTHLSGDRFADRIAAARRTFDGT